MGPADILQLSRDSRTRRRSTHLFSPVVGRNSDEMVEDAAESFGDPSETESSGGSHRVI